MNIVGCILFVIAGIIAIKVSGVTKKQGLSDYSKCNTAIGKVTHTEVCLPLFQDLCSCTI